MIDYVTIALDRRDRVLNSARNKVTLVLVMATALPHVDVPSSPNPWSNRKHSARFLLKLSLGCRFETLIGLKPATRRDPKSMTSRGLLGLEQKESIPVTQEQNACSGPRSGRNRLAESILAQVDLPTLPVSCGTFIRHTKDDRRALFPPGSQLK